MLQYIINSFGGENMLSLIQDNLSLFNSLPCGAAVFEITGNYNIIYSNKIFNSVFPNDRLHIHNDDKLFFSQTLKYAYSPKNRIFKMKNILGQFVRAKTFVKITEDNLALAIIYDDSENYYLLRDLKSQCDRYSAAIIGTDGIFFEYDQLRDTGIAFFSEKENKISTKYVSRWLEDLEHSEYIYSEDIADMRKILKSDIKTPVKKDIRLKLSSAKDFEWFNMIFKPSNRKNIIIGSARNINDIKITEEKLKQNALIDPLSKVYNRAPAIEKITNILDRRKTSDPPCALIVLDIDNFKNINDTYGHIYGDAVISMAAGSVKSVIDKEDIIGRFGGDEFFVYIENADKEYIEKKLNDICSSILKMRLDKNNKSDISCSIGVAVNDAALSYDELFKRADSALYVAKRNGKNRFEYFNGEYIEEGAVSYAAKNLNSKDESNTEYKITTVALEIASKSLNSEDAILNIIRHTGVTMNLDCIQVMRFDSIEDSVSIEFQWNKELNGNYNIVTADRKKGYYHHNDLLAFSNRFHREKVFKYTEEFKEYLSPKYKDVFEKYIANYVFSSNMENESIFWGLCFQSGNLKRVWKKRELDDMLEITKILSVYLKSMYVISEREKMLINKLDYDAVGTFSNQKFFDEAGRIGRFARFSGESLAIASFEFVNLHEYALLYGRAAMGNIIQNFAKFLLKANYDKVISSHSFSTYGFISLFCCKPTSDLADIITEKLDDFCKTIPDADKVGLTIRAGVCLFSPGMVFADAIDTADIIKKDIIPQNGHCKCVITDDIIVIPE